MTPEILERYELEYNAWASGYDGDLAGISFDHWLVAKIIELEKIMGEDAYGN